MTILQAQKQFTAQLQKAHIFSSILDVEVLLSHVLKKPREYILAHPENKISASPAAKLRGMIKKRAEHMPIAYLIGEWDFFGYPFKVNNNVLIPRPESEMLVEEALAILKKDPAAKWRLADVGTGSGAIIVALTKEINKEQLPKQKYEIIASEFSGKALKMAQKNAELNGVEKDIKFLKGDLLKPIKKPINLLIANLPYLSFEEYYNSDFYDVIKWEPKMALTDEKDGLENFRKFFKDAPKVLKSGHLLLEMGYEQGQAITQIIKSAYPKARVKIKKDLCGFDRIIVAQV